MQKLKINEKFVEDTDPVHDMGIGMKRALDKYRGYHGLKNDENAGGYYTLRYLLVHNRYDFADYFMSTNQFDKEEQGRHLFINLIWKKYFDQAFFLLDRIDLDLKQISKQIISEKLLAPNTYNSFKEFLKILKKKQNSSVNEKFTEHSDPIKDLGIGVYAKRTFDTWEDFAEWLYEVAPHILKVDDLNEIIADKEDKSSILKEEYWQILNRYYRRYITIRKGDKDELFQSRFLRNVIVQKNENKNSNMKARTVSEMMGAGATPGMGTGAPASMAATTGAQMTGTSSTGSGDNWGNSINKKPYTQSPNPKKKRKTVAKKRPKKIEEENTNPHNDNTTIGKMLKGGKTSPFKTKKEKGNQNAITTKKFEHEIITFDEFSQQMNENK